MKLSYESIPDAQDNYETLRTSETVSINKKILRVAGMLIFGALVAAITFSVRYMPQKLSSEKLRNAGLHDKGSMASGADVDGVQQLFDDFIVKHGKVYGSEGEYLTRFKNFKENLLIIQSRNAEENAAGGLAVHGITSLADMSKREFQALLKLSPPKQEASRTYHQMVQLKPTTATFSDWRSKYVTAIKNQGSCGCCWAYSSTEQIESDAIRTLAGFDPSLNLSPQQLVDCDRADHACSGGWMPTAWDYVKGTGGVEFASDYPQTAKNKTCSSNSGKYIVGVSSYTGYFNNEAWMQNYVLTTGPIAACFYGVSLTFYTGGIITSCPSTACTHAIQLVGLNTATSPPYWIVSLTFSHFVDT